MNQTGNPASAEPASRPWYAHRWPWLLMLGPAVVVAAGIHTTWLAFTRQDALVVDDYYKQGKAINMDLRRDRAAAELGLTLDLRYDAEAGRLHGRLHSLSGAALRNPLLIRLLHSTLKERDFTLRVEPAADGSFSAPLPMLDMARWQVLVESEQRDWRLQGTWRWPQERELALVAG